MIGFDTWSDGGVALLAFAITLGLALRWPTATLAGALVALAVRPEILSGGPDVGYEWSLHHSIIGAALGGNLIRHGLRPRALWPVAALALILLLNLAFGDLHPRLSVPLMVGCLGVLALPWCLTAVRLRPGSRSAIGLAIAVAPSLSLLLGVALDLAGVRDQDFDRMLPAVVKEAMGGTVKTLWIARLQGATGNAGTFALLAFGGFLASFREWVRTDARIFWALTVANAGLIFLSGTRMAMVAAGVAGLVYLLQSEVLRARLRRSWRLSLTALGALGGLVLLYLPHLLDRIVGNSDAVDLSARDRVWAFQLHEWTLSPVFGRGIGAGFVAMENWVDGLPTPHNDLLHLLVSGGIVGGLLITAGVVAWFRHLRAGLGPEDARYFVAACAGIGSLAMAWDVLVVNTGLTSFAYLGVMLIGTVPAPQAVPHAPAPAPDRAGRPHAVAGARPRPAFDRFRAAMAAAASPGEAAVDPAAEPRRPGPRR